MFESSEITGIAHHERETLYTVRGMSPATISALLAQHGAAFGAIVRQGRAVSFTVPGVDETEVAAAFHASGARVSMQRALGTVSVVGTGINRRPEVTTRALRALADAGVEPELVTSTPSRVSFHIPAANVQDAVRLLHQVFDLHSRRAPVPVRAVS